MQELIKQEELLKNIVEQVINLNKHNASKIRVKIGALTNVTENMIINFFNIAVNSQQITGGVKLEIEKIPVRLQCNVCHKIVSAQKDGYICPECQSEDLMIISGEEFFIEEIE
ncbi:MAG: hydrogenase maturation nickel metallochaperone HypA [Candidatus Wallbacteria bacterium]